jgi:hypothetical protein
MNCKVADERSRNANSSAARPIPAQRLRPPAADGQPYRKGQQT